MRPELRIRPGAYLMAGFWLLMLPGRWILGVLCAAAVHELGHLAALWLLDEPVWAVELSVFGARIETGALKPGQELVCAMAGPVAGALGCLFWRFFPEMAVAAAAQTLFNLMPLYPLDGGRALRAIRNICCK